MEENLVAHSQESCLEVNSQIFCLQEKIKFIKTAQLYDTMKLLFNSPEAFFLIFSAVGFCQNFRWISFSMGIYFHLHFSSV